MIDLSRRHRVIKRDRVIETLSSYRKLIELSKLDSVIEM